MGKKRKDKQILTLVRQCQDLALKATTEQVKQAEIVIDGLKQQFPKPHEAKPDLTHELERIFSKHGDSVGAVVVDRFVRPLMNTRFSRRI
ncbi:hypothetical protein ACNO5E_17575 [Vibrio parahaemolyticus]|jgi:hypothetical protein|uniref:hypothetical protein n=1 Tax=Vibrionaceae TaxID=641 RepID=UPI0010FF5761|nr:hypothetical protein [Photobacterium damselae]MDN4693184.1 hypothetical protein [Vibrio parahaemolyticus]MDN4711027.1 hypothetical protein [Vibrio parahaemolyticus]MDN4711054.1 hypothetical protein [Vibrio parahaemolyticus]TLS65102.1 hypothetical protein FD718_21370 [Photobacterium damselae subsp. damselae]